ncbi:MAG: hypothetical protein QOH41_1721 [Blastocatellia bacterium]|jgi:hypothetical protein|nr:hypothetical protein [Blastocatellia bacterium]
MTALPGLLPCRPVSWQISWQIMSSPTFRTQPVASTLAPLHLRAAKILPAARLQNEARRQRDLLGLTSLLQSRLKHRGG